MGATGGGHDRLSFPPPGGLRNWIWRTVGGTRASRRGISSSGGASNPRQGEPMPHRGLASPRASFFLCIGILQEHVAESPSGSKACDTKTKQISGDSVGMKTALGNTRTDTWSAARGGGEGCPGHAQAGGLGPVAQRPPLHGVSGALGVTASDPSFLGARNRLTC